MRKIKKINGFLVVKFNDREKREYEGTALGEYGVIDAEVYTGNLDIDRGAMEYDDADTLEVAVELARGLESEEDITDEPPTYTAAVETNESYTEETVEPAALIEGWTRRLATQVKSKHYPDTDPRTAAHELYGFKMALHRPRHLTEVHRRTHRLLQRPEQHQERRLRRGHVVLRVRQTDRVHLCKRHQVRLQQRGRGRKGRLAEDPQPPPVL